MKKKSPGRVQPSGARGEHDELDYSASMTKLPSLLMSIFAFRNFTL